MPDTSIDEPTPGTGRPSSAGPRRLDLTLSNRPRPGEAIGRPASKPPGSSTPSPPKCEEAPTKPRPRRKVPIEYTRAARAANIEGRLILQAMVGPSGEVTRVKVMRSLGAQVDEPAAAALRAWTFEPATACGQPVVGRFTIARDFALGD